MDTANYVILSRQAGLARELQVVANNVANMSTTGYRREGVIFAEMIERLEVEGGSVALTDAYARVTSDAPGSLTATGGTFDLAVKGPGYFMVQTEAGQRLTRAGAFSPNAEGLLVNPQGHQLLDAGGAPVFVPPGAGDVRIAGDGTLSADGQPVAQIGRVDVENAWDLVREDGVLFRTDAPLLPVEEGTIAQGFLEEANVNPVQEIARLIEVQRAYESAQRLGDREDERIRLVLRTLGGPG